MATSSSSTAFSVDEKHLVLKYRAVVQEIGPTVAEFLPHNILIFFGQSAPAELREVAVVHDGTQLLFPLVSGDLLRFVLSSAGSNQESEVLWYRVTAVGEAASNNLAELGHVVVHFDGATEAELPGAVSVEPGTTPSPVVGMTFELLGIKASSPTD